METQHGNLTLSKYTKNLLEHDALKLEKAKSDSEEAYDKLIAYKFIQGTDHNRTGKLEEYLANQFDIGVNSYQCNLSITKNMIINYNNYVKNPNHPIKKKKQPKKYLEK